MFTFDYLCESVEEKMIKTKLSKIKTGLIYPKKKIHDESYNNRFTIIWWYSYRGNCQTSQYYLC